SELFGYGPGAFSGARPTGKKGLIQAAQGGTLFLDEIGDLSLAAQAKLLRFLESGSFFRLGESHEISVTTRVVSATNRDLVAMVDEGHFRKDLYFRIGVVKVEVPSLKERRADIAPLALYFMERFGESLEKKVTGFSDDAMAALVRHSWSGNVRELRNVVECAVLACCGEVIQEGELGLSALAEEVSLAELEGVSGFPPLDGHGMDFPAFQNRIEVHYITQALTVSGGNEKQAARLLNMSYHNFRYRRRKWKI
ncbi:MAG: sigma 54-interacting transcriptional regulator, partial [Desulfovibrionales bacterium]|nr:sigma 54-interacting transcriptional regulator [Desulfovibrionales bacterium]